MVKPLFCYTMNGLRRILTFLSHHLYHGLSWSYDLVAATVSFGHWKQWVLGTIPYIQGVSVLELGHGPGHLQRALHARSIPATGLDESRQMGRQALRRQRRHAQQPRLVRALAQSIPFGESFDTVVATFPSDYIADPQTLAEVKRVLHPGGRLVVLHGAWLGRRAMLEALLRRLFKAAGQPQGINEAFWSHFAAPFERAGFEVEVRIEETARSSYLLLLARKGVK